MTAAAAYVVRPRIGREDRLLDWSLVAAIAAAILQLVPLSPAWRAVLSPHAPAIDAALRFDAGAHPGAWRPLTVDPGATATWVPAAVAAVVLFWTARALFARRDLRRVVRGIAWTGLVVSPLALAQLATAPHVIYWYWQPEQAGGITFGPFVNRNHMATWLLLALPLTLGYTVAHVRAHRGSARGARATVDRIADDPATLWLGGAAALMLVALVSSLSRSGMAGLAAATLFWLAAGRAKTGRVHGAAVGVLAAGAIVALVFANVGGLLGRLDRVGDIERRVVIWRQTLAIVRDFPLTGTGEGAYETAMLAYQQQHRYGFFYNQAHDQYLQFAAEGGLLVGVPILLAMVGFVRAAARALGEDRSAILWVRVGACAGLIGVAVQSIWETGLRMPANAILCAVVAAAAIHREERTRRLNE